MNSAVFWTIQSTRQHFMKKKSGGTKKMLKQHAAKYWEWRLVDWNLMVKVDFSNNGHIFKHESFYAL